jgi:hypothetical protein
MMMTASCPAFQPSTPEETLQPRLPPRRHGLDHGQKDDAQAPKNTPSTAPIAASSVRRVRATIHWMAEARSSRGGRPEQKADQAAPVAAQRDHDDERQSNARQGGMRDGVGHQRAFAQEKEGPRRACRKPEQRRRRSRQARRCSPPEAEARQKRVSSGRPGQRQLVDMRRRKTTAIGRGSASAVKASRHRTFGDGGTLIMNTRSKYSATVARS